MSGDRRANGWVRLSPGRRQVLAVLRDEQWHDESKLTNSGTAWRMVQDGLIERDPARRGVNLYSYVTPCKARVRITAFGMSVNDDSNDKARFLSYISEQLPNGCVRVPRVCERSETTSKVGGREVMSKSLAEKHDDLRQTCIRIARHMKMVAAQDRKEAVGEESKAIRDLKTSNATYLEDEAALLVRAAEEI